MQMVPLVDPVIEPSSRLPFNPGAHWISPTGTVANGTFAAYRTQVVLPKLKAHDASGYRCSNVNSKECLNECRSSELAIGADTKYWLYINGELIVAEGGLKRGPTPSGGYFDRVNMSHVPWHMGNNTIAVLVLYLGRRTVPPQQVWWNNEHKDSGVHALLIDGNICGVRVKSDESWRSIPHPAFGNDIADDLSQNFRASEPDIVFDAQMANTLMRCWTCTNYVDNHWNQSIIRGAPGDAPWGALVERPIPQFVRSQHQNYESLRIEVDQHDGDGFASISSTTIHNMDIHHPLPSDCCTDAAACKAACLKFAACKAAVWDPKETHCSLKAATAILPAPNGSTVVFVRAYKRLIGRLPYDAHVTPTLKITTTALPSSANRLRIDIRTDSYFTDASVAAKTQGLGIPNIRAAYLVDTGVDMHDQYETPGWMVGHEVIYTVDAMAPLDLNVSHGLEVGYYSSGYNTALNPPFKCSNEALASLWKKAQRTLYVNMRDSYMDCPDRERSQWTFDVAMDVHQSFYALGTQAQQLSRKWIREVVSWQKTGDDSPSYEPSYAPLSIYAPVPGHWVAELPDQTLQSIAYGFAVYYDHTGDADTMRYMLPHVVGYLLSWRLSSVSHMRYRSAQNSFDDHSKSMGPSQQTAKSPIGMLVVPRSCPGKSHAADIQCDGLWDWCDGQSVNCDYAIIDNAWYFWALNSTLRIAHAVNATSTSDVTESQIRELSLRIAAIKKGFNDAFWDEESGYYISQEHKHRNGGTVNCTSKIDNCTLPDDRSNALAIVTGLAPQIRWRTIASTVLDQSSKTSVAFASTAMEKFVLEALFLAGLQEAALARMQARFQQMISYNLSTLWEHWETDPATGAPFGGYNHGWSGGALVLLSQYVVGLSPMTPGWQEFKIKPNLGVLTDVSASVATNFGDIYVSINVEHLDQVRVNANIPPGTHAYLHAPVASAYLHNITCASPGGCADGVHTQVPTPHNGSFFLPSGEWTVCYTKHLTPD